MTDKGKLYIKIIFIYLYIIKDDETRSHHLLPKKVLLFS
ncbi:hypothetical protein CBY_1766 [Clostridium butyricum 5521]|uniref:Uncharacterized protein n=1 Tax=Clostridium butyricum E4 str. BoNT E BL5262 TaxID=632245 RepID=C4ID55_CLOBU|nr:hypothetical protein CBY_1766 [Clostridium butyricum 5521]EEP55752.1 hypothetical protein CLP_3284 [Clostridium butyricum E4 str. BoNT E BL5262]